MGMHQKGGSEPSSAWLEPRVGRPMAPEAAGELASVCSVSVTSNKLLRCLREKRLRIVEQYEAGRDRDAEYPLKRFRHVLQNRKFEEINLTPARVAKRHSKAHIFSRPHC